MDIFLLVITILLLVAVAGQWYWLRGKMATPETDPTKEADRVAMRDWISTTQRELSQFREELQRMHANNNQLSVAHTSAINERLDAASQVFASVKGELGEIRVMSKSMKELNEFLQSPKLRGNIGEQVLRDLLEQVLSKDQFIIQHPFRDGQIVDAVVKTDQGIIPIDAKFPMENFRKYMQAVGEEKERVRKDFARDVKKHIEAIHKKYILPGEGTVDFAVMYIPAESVYYEVAVMDDELSAFAQGKHVFLVSPNTFYFFLRVILIGMEGRKVEAAATRILATLQDIAQDAKVFNKQLGIAAKHVTNAKNAMDAASSDYTRLEHKIEQTKLLKE